MTSAVPRQSLLRRMPGFCVKLATHPVRTILSKADRLSYLLESLRMRVCGESIFRRRRDLAEASSCPIDMIRKAKELWNPQSVVDVGCGTGKAADYWRETGVPRVVGIEGSLVAIEVNKRPDLTILADLSKPLDLSSHFDLAYSVEVAEHIHPRHATTFVRNLVHLSDRILITAARPGQGGLGHLNEREPKYWEALFGAKGLVRNRSAEDAIKSVCDLYADNVMVYERPPISRQGG